MRAFTMYRRNVPDATHNSDQKNAPHEPQFEGMLFTDGSVAIRWMTAKRSTAVWSSMDDMLAIHGWRSTAIQNMAASLSGTMSFADGPEGEGLICGRAFNASA